MQFHIQNIETDAEKIYNIKMVQLEEQYQLKKEELSKRQEELLIQYAEEEEKEKQELESLRATKAAAIDAARKERLINQKQEDYCLRLPVEEQNDVAILKSIRNRISKPRAVSMVI